jgi:integrase
VDRPSKFAEARALYEAEIEADHTLTDATKNYWRTRIAALLKSWPTLDNMELDKITKEACQRWGRDYAAQFSESNFNNTLGALRAILERGGLKDEANPAMQVKRLGVKPTVLQLPEPAQFEKLLEAIEQPGNYRVPGNERKRKGNYVAPQSKDCADFVRFLAYSGCRKSEAMQVTWVDVDFERGEIRVRNAKQRRTSNHAEFRYVPIIPAMRELLQRLRCQNPHEPTDRVCVVGECEKSLTRACKAIGISRITHHDLRHLFATRCIEAGVDIPTVSRWLGHVDGGALAMKTYGHLRREHSLSMAQKVTFGTSTLPENVTPLPAVAAN